MDQLKSKLGLRQPSAGKSICVQGLHDDCLCAKCWPFQAAAQEAEASQIGDPLGQVKDPEQEPGK